MVTEADNATQTATEQLKKATDAQTKAAAAIELLTGSPPDATTQSATKQEEALAAATQLNAETVQEVTAAQTDLELAVATAFTANKAQRLARGRVIKAKLTADQAAFKNKETVADAAILMKAVAKAQALEQATRLHHQALDYDKMEQEKALYKQRQTSPTRPGPGLWKPTRCPWRQTKRQKTTRTTQNRRIWKQWQPRHKKT